MRAITRARRRRRAAEVDTTAPPREDDALGTEFAEIARAPEAEEIEVGASGD
ncbi:MAG: hypothetical protein LC785_08765 [Acidobacteria bacterium]|nr:hypothetical protein [Acidobacteriota bacterium]